MTNRASCLCGQVTFEVKRFLPAVAHCHCKMCQKFHGAAFSTFAEVKLEDFKWTSGEPLVKHYRSENESVRSFCAECGSSLLFESKYNRQDNTIEVALAAFDELEDISVNANIFCRSQAKWLTDAKIPNFSAFRE